MRLRANILANYAGQGWNAAASVVFVPVYVHFVGVQGYALIGIYTFLQAWLALLDLGMSPTLSRQMARYVGGSLPPRQAVELLRSIEAICAGVALICAVVLALGASWIAVHWLSTTLPDVEVAVALRLCGVVIGMRFMETIYRSALYGLDRQIWFNAVNVAVTTARFGGAALVLALVSPTITAFFLWQLAISVIATTVFRLKAHRTLPAIVAKRFSWPALREIGGFAGGLVGINLTALVLTQGDKLVISHALPLTMLGYYTLAFTISNLITAAVGPISQAFYPMLSRQHAAQDMQGLHSSYSFGAQIVSVAATVTAAILILFPHDLIVAWSGNVALADNSAPIVTLLAAGGLANALLQIPYFTLLAQGEVRRPLYLNVVAAALFLSGLLLFVPVYGLRAAGWAWLLVNIGLLVANPIMLRRQLPGRLRDWAVFDVAMPVLAGLTMAAVARAIIPELESRILIFMAVVLAGAAVSVAAGAAAPALRATILSRIRTGAGLPTGRC